MPSQAQMQDTVNRQAAAIRRELLIVAVVFGFNALNNMHQCDYINDALNRLYDTPPNTAPCARVLVPSKRWPPRSALITAPSNAAKPARSKFPARPA
jgi:hypothetical protein